MQNLTRIKMLYNSILLDGKTVESIYSLYIHNKDYDVNSLHKRKSGYITTYSLLMDLCKQVIVDKRMDMIFDVLERKDLDINLMNNSNHSALYYLMGDIRCTNNRLVLQKFLARHDLDVTTNVIGRYISSCNDEYFDVEILRIMLSKCINFIPNNWGNTIAHIIAKHKPMLICELQAYANQMDINLQNNQGETVLMTLLQHSNMSLLKMLINTFSNINFNICNHKGETNIEFFFRLYSTRIIDIPLYLIKMGSCLDYHSFPDNHFPRKKRYRMRRKIILDVIKQRIVVRNCLGKWAQKTRKQHYKRQALVRQQ